MIVMNQLVTTLGKISHAAEEESGGYWEDDGYIDENGDGDYDEGEE